MKSVRIEVKSYLKTTLNTAIIGSNTATILIRATVFILPLQILPITRFPPINSAKAERSDTAVLKQEHRPRTMAESCKTKHHLTRSIRQVTGWQWNYPLICFAPRNKSEAFQLTTAPWDLVFKWDKFFIQNVTPHLPLNCYRCITTNLRQIMSRLSKERKFN